MHEGSSNLPTHAGADRHEVHECRNEAGDKAKEDDGDRQRDEDRAEDTLPQHREGDDHAEREEAGNRKQLIVAEKSLDYAAELRATRRQTMRLAEWEGVLDTFLSSNELPKLQGAGSISAEAAKRIAHDRYDAFDAKRKEAARQAAAEVDDLDELKRIADATEAEKKGRRDA